MPDNVIDNMLSNDILQAFVDVQYELCCDVVRAGPNLIRPPTLIVATASSTPGKAGDLHAHVFDDGLGNAPQTLYAVGRSFGLRYLIVSAAILALQATGVRIAKVTEETKEVNDPQNLGEGIIVCALAADGRCIVKAAAIHRSGDGGSVTIAPSTGSEEMAEAGHGNVLSSFYDGYEAGLAEVQQGQRVN